MLENRCVAAGAIAVFATLSLALLLTGCGGESYTLKTGRLSVGSPPDVVPFETFVDGRLTGFDMELAQAIADKLGLEFDYVKTRWEDLLPDLKAGKYDMVMAAMTITFERQKEYGFSSPYFETHQSVVVKKGSPIASGSDLAGKVVGVLDASTPLYAAEKINVIREIKKYGSVEEVYGALEAGEVDAQIIDLSIAQYRSRTDEKTTVVAEIQTDEQYGIAVRKGNDALLGKLNGALGRLREDGTYDRIYREWFGAGD